MQAIRLRSAYRVIAALAASLAAAASFAQQPPGFTVIASGLQGPRGLAFGPDGALYVAEAGMGGKNLGSKCDQVPPPVGPYTGAKTARISKIAADGTRTTVASGFPSTQDAMGDVIGVADIAFMDGTLYALIGGGGCSHGNPDSANGVARVDRASGKWTLIADLGAWLKANPAKYESADDFEPDGTPYSMIVANGVLNLVEPNHGQVVSVSRHGEMHQVIDISASEGHIVPTSIAQRDGAFYVGNLNLFPIDPQWARILTIARDDERDLAPGFAQRGRGPRIINSKAGFTTVVAVRFGPDGLLYALELSDSAGFPTGGAGKVLRVRRSGDIEEVITGLTVPTGMTFGPDGRLYISDLGAAPPGAGRILRFDVAPGD